VTALQGKFKEAWSQALAGVNAAEHEAEKVLGRIADAAGFTPEDVRRHAREFAERLRTQRREIEKALDEAVRKAAAKVRLPSRGEVETLRQRVDALTARLEALEGDRQKPAA
jgi:polyhydroxyalkanoate synthesis regulator phasin